MIRVFIQTKNSSHSIISMLIRMPHHIYLIAK